MNTRCGGILFDPSSSKWFYDSEHRHVEGVSNDHVFATRGSRFGLEHWARGKSVTAEEIHDVLRSGPVRFLIVPRAFSDNEFYRLDVLRLNDPVTQARTPPEIYRNGEFSNMFYTADAIVGEATAFVWRKIARYLRESANGEDRTVGDAIAERLGDLEGVEPEAVLKVELGRPTDWMKRVFAVQGRVSLADDD